MNMFLFECNLGNFSKRIIPVTHIQKYDQMTKYKMFLAMASLSNQKLQKIGSCREPWSPFYSEGAWHIKEDLTKLFSPMKSGLELTKQT